MSEYKAGYISIIGRPNVGKSTLLNQLLKQKLSIISRKPQTTRQHILGIKTDDHAQLILIDTPGIQLKPTCVFNKYMNKEAINALYGVDIVMLLIEADQWKTLDDYVLNKIMNSDSHQIFLVINKIDKLKQKESLLALIKQISQQYSFNKIIPIAAKKNINIDLLESQLIDELPVHPMIYPSDQITNKDDAFFIAEIMREKLITKLGHELPYQLAIHVEHMEVINHVYHIHMLIWVQKKGQKKIIIGKNGKLLKSVGTDIRKNIEVLFGKKVHLKTWVKVKEQWTQSNQALIQLGYTH